jgi:hypothetical protein
LHGKHDVCSSMLHTNRMYMHIDQYFMQACRGPTSMDTAGPLYNLHYLNGLGPPRSPITKNSRRLLWSNDSERRRINPAANLPDWTIHMPFYSGRQPATLLRSALKVLESAKYPTIQFRHITSTPPAGSRTIQHVAWAHRLEAEIAREPVDASTSGTRRTSRLIRASTAAAGSSCRPSSIAS